MNAALKTLIPSKAFMESLIGNKIHRPAPPMDYTPKPPAWIVAHLKARSRSEDITPSSISRRCGKSIEATRVAINLAMRHGMLERTRVKSGRAKYVWKRLRASGNGRVTGRMSDGVKAILSMRRGAKFTHRDVAEHTTHSIAHHAIAFCRKIGAISHAGFEVAKETAYRKVAR